MIQNFCSKFRPDGICLSNRRDPPPWPNLSSHKLPHHLPPEGVPFISNLRAVGKISHHRIIAASPARRPTTTTPTRACRTPTCLSTRVRIRWCRDDTRYPSPLPTTTRICLFWWDSPKVTSVNHIRKKTVYLAIQFDLHELAFEDIKCFDWSI